MSKKPTVTTVASGYYGRQALNDNFEALRDAFDNTLSRDGSTPNAMGADFDMNGYRILNAGQIDTDALYLNGIRVAPVGGVEYKTSYLTASYTGDGSTVAYALTADPQSEGNVSVYVDGVYQNKDTFSLSGTTLTFSEAPPLNAAIEIVYPTATDTLNGSTSSAIVYNQGGTGAQDRNVQQKLQEFVSVKDFGAVGDGVTDDTAAIQAAIDNGKPLYAPDGTYIHTGLTIKNNTVIKGAGKGITVFKLKAGSNTDSFISFDAYNFINGTNIDMTQVPDDIILTDFTIDGNWADWTFPRSPTNQPVYNTSGNGLVLYTQRSTVNLGIINCAEMFMYYKRAATENLADGLDRRMRSHININCRYCGKQGVAVIDNDSIIENLDVIGVAVLVNGVAPTSSSLITDADGDVAGVVLDGGDYGYIHVSGPHQGASGDDSPAVKVIGGINALNNVVTEGSRSGIYLKAGQTNIIGGTTRDLKDTTASSYQLKIDSDFNQVNLKVRRFTGQANADSDIKSIQVNSDNNQLQLSWFNATNPSTAALFQGDAVSVSGDSNHLDLALNSPSGSGLILEAGAKGNLVNMSQLGGGSAIDNISVANNSVYLTAVNVGTGIVSTALPNYGLVKGSVQIASGGAYYSGTAPTISSGTKWEIVGLDNTSTIDRVTEIKGVQNGTIATGNAFALVTITLSEELMWTPSAANVRLNVSSTTTTMVTAQIYSVSTTSLVVRLATPSTVGSDLTVGIAYEIDLNS